VCEISGKFVVGEEVTVVVRMRANPRPYLNSWTAGDNDLDRERFSQMDAGEVKLIGVGINNWTNPLKFP
jgi:hypothetical protein